MTSNHPSAGTFWKKLGLQFTALLAAFILIAWGAAAGYQSWKSRSVANEARAQFAKGDFRAAHGAAERALLEDPELLEAAEIAAESLDKLDSPGAVEAWARFAQLRQGNPDAAVKWARAALKWKRDTVALGALHTVPEVNRENAGYQLLLGDVLVAQERFQEAEPAYLKAVALAPANKSYVLQHAGTIAAHSDDPEKLKAAETALLSLGAQPDYRMAAHRALAALNIRRKDWPAALAANAVLLKSPETTADDRVQQLEILHQLGGPEFQTSLAAAQKNAREARETATIFAWMNRSGMAAEALQWAAGMEPRIARNPELARRIAESHMILKDWRNLRKQCDDLESWGPYEHLRSAYAARALRQMDDIINANHRWLAAVGAANSSRESTAELLKLATDWNWRDEVRDMLWDAANRIDARWALGKLADMYTTEGSTDGLLRVFTRKTELDPNDDVARNAMVRLSLLRDQSVESSLAQARMLAKRHPSEATFAATLALGELKGGRGIDAIAAFAKVASRHLGDPESAFYHGLALFAAGRESDAAIAFSIAQKRRLLPEETQLLPPAFRGTVTPPAR